MSEILLSIQTSLSTLNFNFEAHQLGALLLENIVMLNKHTTKTKN